MKKPHIFLMMAEDICPNLGCYGDKNAKTPRLDDFARENIRFDKCYSAAPVCSAARTSLNLGMYGPSAGVGHHRSYNHLPPEVSNIGVHMQNVGYYTAISKTDFNFSATDGYDVNFPNYTKDTPAFTTDLTDILAKKPEDQPFFVVHTCAATHQSQYGFTEDTAAHRATIARQKPEELQKREDITVPDYQFDSPETREIWGQYHEKMAAMDRMFGEFLDAIRDLGLYEDSIILFVGDNGHGIPSGKCNLWNEGVHVPFLLHVPKDMESELELLEDEFGRFSNRLTSFVDFGATFLSVIGEKIPENFQGRAILGKNQEKNPEYVYSFSERVDEVQENSRSMHSQEMLYFCDFGLTPYKRLNVYQTTQSPWFCRSMIEKGYENNISDTERRALFRQIPRNGEELFDLKNDKPQLNNLSKDPKHQETLGKMREALYSYIQEIHDDVFMPEALTWYYTDKTGKTPYEILRDKEIYPLDRLVTMAKAGFTGQKLPTLDKSATLAEKIWYCKFATDRGENLDLVETFVEEGNEVLSAYVHYRLKQYDKLEEITKTTKNPVLILMICDMIAVLKPTEAMAIFTLVYDRYFHKNEFETIMAERYHPAMFAALNMLMMRFGVEIPKELDPKIHWNMDKFLQTQMVLGALQK